jgi:hypothetical protein
MMRAIDPTVRMQRDRAAINIALLHSYRERPMLLRDLLELVVSEDHGLFHEIDPSCAPSKSTKPTRCSRVREIIAAVRIAGLEGQPRRRAPYAARSSRRRRR